MKSLKFNTLHGDTLEFEPGDKESGYPNHMMISGLGPWEAFSKKEVKQIIKYLQKWVKPKKKKKKK